MRCSPRPVSAREPGVRGAGAVLPGSATAHSTQGPGCSRPSRIGRRGRVSPDPGRACRSALVTSSDTTIAMSGLRSCRAPPAQGGDGEVPGGADRSGIRAERARGDPRQAGPARQGGIRRWPPAAAGQAGHLRGRHQPAAAGARLQAGPLRCHQRPVNVIAPAGPARARSAIIRSWPGSLPWPGAAGRPPRARQARTAFKTSAAGMEVPAGFPGYLPAGMASAAGKSWCHSSFAPLGGG